MGILLLAIVLMVVLMWLPVRIARRKGRSGIGFFLLSFLVSPLVAIVIASIISPNIPKVEEKEFKAGKRKKCPACAEIIKLEATVCKHCGVNC